MKRSRASKKKASPVFGRITISYGERYFDLFAKARAKARAQGRSFSAYVVRVIQRDIRRSGLKIVVVGGLFLGTSNLGDLDQTPDLLANQRPGTPLEASGHFEDRSVKPKRAA